jgi:hypothetical protein
MGATEEQMILVAGSGIDHVAYILILYSLAFLMFLFVMMLITLYERNYGPSVPPKDIDNGRLGPRLNGEVPLRDAQEFELEGLMSDDDDDETGTRLGDNGLESPSTLGKNSEGVAH